MRLRLPMRRTMVFLALFAFSLILFLPLRLVLGAAGDALSAREARGVAWSGRLVEARAGPAALGDLDARIAPLPLLVGRARLDVERDSAAADRLAGAFGIARNRRSADSVTGVIPVEGAFGALPIAALELTDVSVRFVDGQCEAAEGMVTARLSGGAPGVTLPASISGSARCDRGALLLPLTSGAGNEGAAVRIFGDGRYTAELRQNAATATIEGRF